MAFWWKYFVFVRKTKHIALNDGTGACSCVGLSDRRAYPFAVVSAYCALFFILFVVLHRFYICGISLHFMSYSIEMSFVVLFLLLSLTVILAIHCYYALSYCFHAWAGVRQKRKEEKRNHQGGKANFMGFNNNCAVCFFHFVLFKRWILCLHYLLKFAFLFGGRYVSTCVKQQRQ